MKSPQSPEDLLNDIVNRWPSRELSVVDLARCALDKFIGQAPPLQMSSGGQSLEELIAKPITPGEFIVISRRLSNIRFRVRDWFAPGAAIAAMRGASEAMDVMGDLADERVEVAAALLGLALLYEAAKIINSAAEITLTNVEGRVVLALYALGHESEKMFIPYDKVNEYLLQRGISNDDVDTALPRLEAINAIRYNKDEQEIQLYDTVRFVTC